MGFKTELKAAFASLPTARLNRIFDSHATQFQLRDADGNKITTKPKKIAALADYYADTIKEVVLGVERQQKIAALQLDEFDME